MVVVYGSIILIVRASHLPSQLMVACGMRPAILQTGQNCTATKWQNWALLPGNWLQSTALTVVSSFPVHYSQPGLGP